MVNYVATNSTLFNLGASGDNMIMDGYVRAVEKVWIDSYLFGATLMTTSDTLLIGYVPANKKIVGVEVYVPQSLTPTTCAICVGISGSTSLFISSSTAYIVASFALTTSAVALNCVRLNNPAGFAYVVTSGTASVSGGTFVTGINTPIYLSLTGANITAPTASTNALFTTIIRYT